MSSAEGYEKKDINPWTIIIYSVVGIAILAGMVILVYDIYLSAKEEIYYEAVLQPESKDLINIRAVEDSLLNNYQVIDAEKDIYRIPVEEAMRIIARENS